MRRGIAITLAGVLLAGTAGCATVPKERVDPLEVGHSAFSIVQEETTRLRSVSEYGRLQQLRIRGYDLKGEEPEGNVLYFPF